MTVDRRVVPFKRWHYDWVSNLAEGKAPAHMTTEIMTQVEGLNSWTGVVNGDPIACAGTIPEWPGRYTAWAYMSLATGPHMRWLTQEVKRRIENVRGRIEFTVRCDFDAGHRWARMLGFEIETPVMRAYGPFGEDHARYVRFN